MNKQHPSKRVLPRLCGYGSLEPRFLASSLRQGEVSKLIDAYVQGCGNHGSFPGRTYAGRNDRVFPEFVGFPKGVIWLI